ncbi:MAG TPA: flagellar basal-body MS-ring/collar protein FliF [Croceibacterium sp.]|nr:flagellar basal-body MS-ring/collar protein FliF [Croceibacterium sp.]
MLEKMRGLAAQPAVRKAMPWFVGMAAIGAAALAWTVISPTPQRTLYTQLDDSQRADVAGALDKASIGYSIDNQTGALTVNEEDLYRARMVVASDGALATPESGIELLDNLPLGASRTMEGERLRIARERELMLTIKEIDGVEAVRVHLAEPEHSVFVRDEAPPSASVMVRLAKGRQLSDSQTTAIANLVASSVTGLPVDNVRIVDQNGRLLSEARSNDTSGLELQAQMEEKLRAQVSQLLAPVLGPDNFSSEIQVELDLEARTSARESYDKQGVVREETQETTRSAGTFGGIGVPGALSNTPPAPGTVQPGANGAEAAPMGAQTPPSGETRASRSYELGREVAVTNVAPGGIKRISVAVAVSAAAMKNGKASDIEKIKSLVSAAVGAVPERGDQVEVITRNFAENAIEAPAFYETGWFAMIVRYVAALVGVLLILLLGVRPLLRALRGRGGRDGGAAVDRVLGSSGVGTATERTPDAIDRSLLNRQVGAAQKVVDDRPDRAVIAIRQMLSQNQ